MLGSELGEEEGKLLGVELGKDDGVLLGKEDGVEIGTDEGVLPCLQNAHTLGPTSYEQYALSLSQSLAHTLPSLSKWGSPGMHPYSATITISTRSQTAPLINP